MGELIKKVAFYGSKARSNTARLPKGINADISVQLICVIKKIKFDRNMIVNFKRGEYMRKIFFSQ